ncbi:predicted protein [Chaetomium globosum CBS 148.51]|uniref:Uncharacterized protein n=1 Tax=Chaetomium globosum (strain ATCC 6205 / CBS 148.51 / DSM 1962 / NBRC 6347 / NRRL 1970) TaxID=306901 RepID=Q2GZG7_CHAGB|nr:uncharacterized protein CHGG_05079 [Chaetomium globosum CBS 148.51]EAQ88460.1 predicted protein [Chaetomium globosum CBS 148.51]
MGKKGREAGRALAIQEFNASACGHVPNQVEPQCTPTAAAVTRRDTLVVPRANQQRRASCHGNRIVSCRRDPGVTNQEWIIGSRNDLMIQDGSQDHGSILRSRYGGTQDLVTRSGLAWPINSKTVARSWKEKAPLAAPPPHGPVVKHASPIRSDAVRDRVPAPEERDGVDLHSGMPFCRPCSIADVGSITCMLNNNNSNQPSQTPDGYPSTPQNVSMHHEPPRPTVRRMCHSIGSEVLAQHTSDSHLVNVANQDPHVGLPSGAGFSDPQHHDANPQNIEEGANERGRGRVTGGITNKLPRGGTRE